MKHLSDAEKWKILAREDLNQAASHLAGEKPRKAEHIADGLGAAYMVNVVCQLGTDVAADLLRNLPADFTQKVLTELPPGNADTLREILSYPEGTAGSLMAKEILAVPRDATIGRALESLRGIPDHAKGRISYVYVTDDRGRLDGVLRIRDLIFHSPEGKVREISQGPVVQVEAGMSVMDVATILQRHRFLGVPVVDGTQRLIGVVSADNVIKVLQERSAEELARLIGTGSGEMKTPSIRKIVGLRLPWLLFSILSGFLCAVISGFYQSRFQALVVLFLFVPLVLALSESLGIQGATIVVRHMAVRGTSAVRLLRLYLREAAGGLVLSLICGILIGAGTLFLLGDPRLGTALFVSMITAMAISALIGLTMPFFFRKIGIDPAIASGPLVLAVCDLQTLLIYFYLAGSILEKAA